jgi:hypothetical protein
LATYYIYVFFLGTYYVSGKLSKNFRTAYAILFFVVGYFIWILLTDSKFATSIINEYIIKKKTKVDYDMISKERKNEELNHIKLMQKEIEHLIKKNNIQKAKSLYWIAQGSLYNLKPSDRAKISKKLNKIKETIDKNG